MKRRRVKRNPVPVVVAPAALKFVTRARAKHASDGDVLELDDGRLARIKVDARSRTIRAYPIEGGTARGLDKAGNAFRAFSGMEPGQLLEVKSGPVPKVAWLLGELEEVLYNTERDGKRERYLHKFKKTARPLIAVDPDTGKPFLVGGDYTVTDRGFTDH